MQDDTKTFVSLLQLYLQFVSSVFWLVTVFLLHRLILETKNLYFLSFVMFHNENAASSSLVFLYVCDTVLLSG